MSYEELERRCEVGYSGAPGGTGLRVLLAEGDADNAEFMTLLLQTDGHQVRVAGSGPSALRLAQAEPPDVLLLEIRLPGMDGWEVVRRLRGQAAERRPFCIALTCYGTEEDRRLSEEAGIDLHLVKPLGYRHLRAVLRRFQTVIGSGGGREDGAAACEAGHRLCPALP